MKQISSEEIKKQLQVFSQHILDIDKQAREFVVGKKVKVVTDFNGQIVGSSRPSLKGKIFIIAAVALAGNNVWLWNGNYNHCCMDLRDVEFCEEP